MTVMVVPPLDETPWPTLGPEVVAWMRDHLVYGPGDLRGVPYDLDDEKIGLVYRMYEVYPKDHPEAGRRRFRRCCLSMRKGSAKSELGAAIAAAELAPDGPVRFDGWRKVGRHWEPVGRPVTDPYVPMLAYTEEQSEELAFQALYVMLSEGPYADDYDFGKERVMRRNGDGKAAALATAPDARDGARTTFELFDEPLALDTPVPTPDGWTTIGEIEAGDSVFGVDGSPALVLGVSPVRVGRPCFRVTFSDQTSVVTDAGHRWAVIDRAHAYRGLVQMTTGEMASSMRTRSGCFRWSVPQPAPIQMPDRNLPIDPYVLGAWLGDGDATAPTIHQSEADAGEMMEALAAAGSPSHRISGRTAVRMYVDGLRTPLRTEGLLGAKRIPDRYLRASAAQRMALVRGLMDTDGHVTPGGWVAFVTNRMAFAIQVAELLRSLGFKPSVRSVRDDRSRTGEMVKVSFMADASRVPFRMARKAARCSRPRGTNSRTRSIVAIESVESVPVKCIGVDNADHLFLVGEGMVPTHNTHRLTLPRQKEAHRTMLANLPKRKIADPWALETTTAPAPGQSSVAENTMDYAKQVLDGAKANSRLFFFHRQATDGKHDLTTRAGVRAAVLEASGPVAGWSDVEGIVDQWDDPTADRAYLARVWLNMLVRATESAFDPLRMKALAKPDHVVKPKAAITLGFDGSLTDDWSALVATEVSTGFQWVVGWWNPASEPTREIDKQKVDVAVAKVFHDYTVVRFYVDPPYWKDELAEWQGRYGEKVVIPWYTYRTRQMAAAVLAFDTAIRDGSYLFDGDDLFVAHVGNCRRLEHNEMDDGGKPIWTVQKETPYSPHKIDIAVSAILSREARNDALGKALAPEPEDSWLNSEEPMFLAI